MGMSTRGVIAIGATCAGYRDGAVWPVSEVMAVAATGQVRSWGKALMARGGLRAATRNHRVLGEGGQCPVRCVWEG